MLNIKTDLPNYHSVEVTLPDDDSFLKIKETLTRIGVASRKDNTLYQSAHILHKRGKFYIVHFKELFLLDERESNLTETDVQRRNAIAALLQDWGLLKVVDAASVEDKAPISQIKIIKFSEKDDWVLQPKYAIGARQQKKS